MGFRVDQDEDGIVREDDCDDADFSVGAEGLPENDISDFNGDGVLDEDESSPIDIGSLIDNGNQVSATGFVIPSSDTDSFQFYFEDKYDFCDPWFGLADDNDEFICTLSNVPDSLDASLTIVTSNGVTLQSDSNGFGGSERDLLCLIVVRTMMVCTQ